MELVGIWFGSVRGATHDGAISSGSTGNDSANPMADSALLDQNVAVIDDIVLDRAVVAFIHLVPEFGQSCTTL